MRRLSSHCFGEIEFPDSAVFQFPSGLPGFEDERAFVFLERPDTHPLIFMHSLSQPDLCFILLPVLAADPNYRLTLTADEISELELPQPGEVRIGADLLCGALVSAADRDRPGPTVNLLAPIVVNLKKKLGIQAIQTCSGYSHRHPLPLPEEVAPCL
jgi:flagellar assembly factor FliW